MARKNSFENYKIRSYFENGKAGIPIDLNNPEHNEKLTNRLIEAVRPYGYVYIGRKGEKNGPYQPDL